MKCFVAGATGVLGRRAVRELVRAGHEVTGVARTEEKAALVRALGATPALLADLFDASAVRAAVAGHDVVVNLATHVPEPSKAAMPGAWSEHERIRDEGARNLVDAANAAGATVYVQESLAFVYEDGGDRWLDESTPLVGGRVAGAVRAAEGHAERFDGRWVVLRFGEFYSHDSSHTDASIRLARRGASMKIGKGGGYAPVIAADDAATAVVAAVDRAPSGVYNVCDDEPMTRKAMDAELARAVGARRLLRASPMAGESGAIFRLSNRSSNARFKEATGWAPRFPSVREGYPAMLAESAGGGIARVQPILQTAILLVLALNGFLAGVHATFWPRSFFDDFPGGMGWVAADPPYNEHLIRDFGGLNLGLGLVALVAALAGGRALVRAATGAWLLFGVPHLVYHLRHLDNVPSSDQLPVAVSLSMTAVIAAVALAMDLRPSRA
ncbi:MAG TPA: NAD(P)-dependent oxidoreductase [Acidimicrobiales bacterium]|nr:NAD(P)-dependent oxidoreductase [Acidimicrobiales bacterium]